MSKPQEPKFENPYIGAAKQNAPDLCRFNTDCDKDEYFFVKLLRPQSGTMATTINTLFHKLVLELKSRGIVDITHKKQFEHFVANCRIALPEELRDGRATATGRTVANKSRGTTRRTN